MSVMVLCNYDTSVLLYFTLMKIIDEQAALFPA